MIATVKEDEKLKAKLAMEAHQRWFIVQIAQSYNYLNV